MGNTASDNVVIRNIFYMLAYATGTSGNDVRSSLDSILSTYSTEEFSSYLDLIAALLVNTVDAQRLRGFERVYFPVIDELSFIKGKVNIRESMLRRARGSLRLTCSFEELSVNTYMNRIIKTTMVHLLRFPELAAEMRRRLILSLILLDNVGEIDPRVIDWNRLRFSRLNQSYRLIMPLCQMILEKKVPIVGQDGNSFFPNLFSKQRLSSLFEHFVLAYFKKHYPALRPRSRYVDYGIEQTLDILPKLKADIVLQGNEETLIIDTKCYGKILQTNCDKEILSPEHRNQILSYVLHLDAEQCDAFDAQDNQERLPVSGMLLYAQTSLDGKIDKSWAELGHVFRVSTLDLSVDFQQIANQLDSIVKPLL